MTDQELIARLRVDEPACEEHFTANLAADRIGELEKKCSAYARADQLFVDEINELEAKLAKAMDEREQALNSCEQTLDERDEALAKLTKAVGFLKTMVDYNEYVIAPFLAELGVTA